MVIIQRITNWVCIFAVIILSSPLSADNGAYILKWPSDKVKVKGNYNNALNSEGEWNFYYDTHDQHYLREDFNNKKQIEFLQNGKQKGNWAFLGDSRSWHLQKQQVFYKNGVREGKTILWYQLIINGVGTDIKEIGSYLSGKAQGKWLAYYKSGKTRAVGSFNKGKEEGGFTFYYEDVKIEATQQYVSGKKDGTWAIYHKDGKIISKAVYKEGQRNGLWQEWYLDGQKKVAVVYVNGKRHGQYQKWHENGKIAQLGFYGQGKQTGIWTEFYLSGAKKANYGYSNGLPVGNILQWHENGKIQAQGAYINGQKSGLWQEWDPNGKVVASYFYQNGKLQGKFFRWLTDYPIQSELPKEPEQGFYINGKPEGKHIQFSANQAGIFKTETHYKNGALIKLIRYYPSGIKYREENYLNGKKEGKTLCWDNEQISCLEEYKQDKLHGAKIIYHTEGPNRGKKKSEAFYKNGQPDGKWTEWDEKGLVTKVTFYKEGRIKAGEQQLGFDEGTSKYRTFRFYKNWKKEGKWTTYYDGLNLKWECSYKDDLAEGVCTTYYINGLKQSEKRYQRGKPVGRWLQWDENGKIIKETVYK